MRFVSRVALVLSVVAVAGAMGGSPAAAQGPIQLTNEITSDPCDPCVMHIFGASEMWLHVGPIDIPISSCTEEYTAVMNEDGTGEIHAQSMTGPNCTRVPCNGVGEAPGEAEWPIYDPSEIFTGPRARFKIRACLDVASNPNATGVHCEISAVAHPPDVPHDYDFTVTQINCGTNVELIAVWRVELGCCGGHDVVEINHT